MNKSRVITIGFSLLLVNATWVWSFPEATLFYVANVLLHIVLGLGLIGVLLLWRNEWVPSLGWKSAPAAGLLAVSGALGAVLCVIGATQPHRLVLVIHIGSGYLGALALWWHARRLTPQLFRTLGMALAGVILVGLSSVVQARLFPSADQRIVNPSTAPLSMEQEGGGVSSPFFPSSAVTNTGGLIPSDFFLDSKVCGECHKDVYEQWNSSMHHFSSFNNQFYRKAIEYMQEVDGGVDSSKWCAGCHDHAMFFNGRFDKPVKDQIDTPAAQAGLGCMSCHSITHVADTMGNGGFTMTYPPLHGMGSSDNWLIRTLHDYVVNTAPEAHRRAFMPAFMLHDRAEFCSSCHKVHLDVPVNNYRWFRGFNEYDSWQASGVSGQGARSFYYPETPSDCKDCHMPLVPSDDPGNDNGFVRSHRFPGANTAVPYVNRDEEQLKTVIGFLKNDIVSVDIFAISPVEPSEGALEMRRRGGGQPMLSTGFAVGEEAPTGSRPILLREVGRIAAPIDRVQPTIQPGTTVKVDVVVRTKKIGHFFPGGTVDAFDVWLELQATDARGRIIYWSGRVEDDGKGPVEAGAHFYRSFLLDEHGNPINKRNAFHARSLLYARLIPPGAADTAHFRMTIPEDVEGPVSLVAKLNYRKFSHYYTQFAYAGRPDPNSEGSFGKGYDDREFTFSVDDIPKNVSGEIKAEIPNLPIIVLAEDRTQLQVRSSPAGWKPAAVREDYERWNDYGIGLLLQGDLKGAEFAFQRVTEADPGFADGWLNIARALVQEGQTDAAKPYVAKALEIEPNLARAHFFRAKAQRADGDYDAALASLRIVESQYPRDRVVLNEIAQILFRQRQYQQALVMLDRVARIDPEDLQMHYTRMLCYRGIGDEENAAREEKLFRRFKADEASQTITARIRRLSPEDNNERQPIHEHLSVEIPEGEQPNISIPGSAGGQP